MFEIDGPHGDSWQGEDNYFVGADVEENFLYGDVRGRMLETARGDNSENYMYGDAGSILDNALGGNDTLVSGTDNDRMWGDANTMADTAQGGADTYVFGPHNGDDFFRDFEQGKDVIDLTWVDLYLLKGHVPIEKMPPHALEVLKHVPSTQTGWDALDSNDNGMLDDGDRYVSYGGEGSDTVIDLGAAQLGAAGVDLLTVVGVTGLTEADFVI